MGINAKQKITAVLLVIIAIIVVFSIVGSTSNDLSDSGDAITDANGCDRIEDSAGELMTFNTSSRNCINSTGNDDIATGNQVNTLPLNNLFASNGVIFLIFMAGVLLMVIIMVLKGVKGKK